jgi:hypothetical protein
MGVRTCNEPGAINRRSPSIWGHGASLRRARFVEPKATAMSSMAKVNKIDAWIPCLAVFDPSQAPHRRVINNVSGVRISHQRMGPASAAPYRALAAIRNTTPGGRRPKICRSYRAETDSEIGACDLELKTDLGPS